MLKLNDRKVNTPGAPIQLVGMWLLALAAAGLLLAVSPAVAQKQFTVSPLDQVEPLTQKRGYLLLDLDVHGVAPSVEFAGLVARGTDYPDRDAKLSAKKSRLIGKFDLGGLENGLHLISMPEGWYQITRVNAPFFDLPYKLTTSSDPEWRFGVEKGKTNYVGTLSISKERSAGFVEINLHNRIATDIERIETQLAHVLPEAPLRSGSGVRDDFFKDLKGANE